MELTAINQSNQNNQNDQNSKILSIDLETYSDVDLGKCGLYKYVEGDFHILLFAYAFDDEPVQIVDLACGEKLPQEVVDAIFNENIIKAAWNAQFERTCLSKYFGTQLSPDSWRCSMVHAASLSLPLKLKTAAEVLRVSEQKDSAGDRLIKYFSVPCKPTKKNGGRTRNLPEHEDKPGDWQKFKDYCLQDVRTERAIRQKLERFPLLEHEWDYYHMDQRINDRGVLIDTELVTQAIKCDQIQAEFMLHKAYELTGLENPNSVIQLKSWLTERGISIETLGKKDVAAMISDLDKDTDKNSAKDGKDQEALEMLKLRLQMAKSSIKKYQAAERCACKDGRARGLFQFSGANRTARWAGRFIQLQNLFRNELSTLNEARELIKLGCFDMVALLYGNVPDVLSQLIRTMLIPKPGCKFIVADFSAIEARVLAWLAGEQWRLDAFKRGEDIYCASASAMFGVPVVKHGINGELRQKGKIAELACIAEGQLVLTDKGLFPIENVTTVMKIWDGKEWVNHDGVVYRGEREVITYEGLTATTDHLVFIEGQSRPIRFDFAASIGAHLVQTGYGRHTIRLGKNHQSGKTMESSNESMLRFNRMSRMWLNSMAKSIQSKIRKIEGLPKLHAAKANSVLVRSKTYSRQTTMRKSERSGILKLWCERNKVRISKCNKSWTLFNSKFRDTEQSFRNRPYRQQRKLRTWKYSLRDKERELCKQTNNCFKSIQSRALAIFRSSRKEKTLGGFEQRRDYPRCENCCIRETKKLAWNTRTVKVYDILNAGRHHRFTVSGKLVHNCGYQGGTGALTAMGALDMGLKEDDLPKLIEDWRTANPNIVKFWYDLEKSAMDTINDHQDRTVGKIDIQYYANTLWLVLPSGRKLAYINPKIAPNRFGRMSLIYEGLNAANKWDHTESYGGKLAENITQSTARDLLAEAMWRMEQAGLDIVAHVHDEIVLEVPMNTISAEDVCKIMNQNPAWAEGLPLSSAGYSGNYYFKD